MKLSDYKPTRQIQLRLLASLEAAKQNPCRTNMMQFLWCASQATKSGIGLDVREIEDIFDEIYKDS